MNATTEADTLVIKESTSAGIKRFRTAPFALVIFCLFLPFFKVSCALDPTMQKSVPGRQLITWSHYGDPPRHVIIHPNKFAVAFVALTILAGFFSQRGKRSGLLGSTFISLVAIAVLFMLKAHVSNQIEFASKGLLRLQTYIGFYASMVLLGLSAVFHCYLWQEDAPIGVPDG